MKIKCGDANPKGNIELIYKGGCKKELNIEDAYRCTGCGGWFHKECITKHFKMEKEHDYGKEKLRKSIYAFIKKKKLIHKRLSEEIVGNNDYHIGAIDELNRLKLYLEINKINKQK